MIEEPYHRIIRENLIIGISRPTDSDIDLALDLLSTFKHGEYIQKKLKANMVIEGESK